MPPRFTSLDNNSIYTNVNCSLCFLEAPNLKNVRCFNLRRSAYNLKEEI